MEGTSTEQSGPEHMKLSIEAKVAAAVALAFAVLSIGAIAQEGSQHGSSAARSQSGLQATEISLSLESASSENRLLAQY